MNESFVEYEWSLESAEGFTVAAGSAKTFDEANAELSHYIFMYHEESESLRFEISGVSRTVISSGTIAKDTSKYQSVTKTLQNGDDIPADFSKARQ